MLMPKDKHYECDSIIFFFKIQCLGRYIRLKTL